MSPVTNNSLIKLSDIPLLDMGIFLDEILKDSGMRPVSLFGTREDKKAVRLIVIMAHDDDSRLAALSAMVNEGDSYRSLTPAFPAFHLFERELAEQFSLTPLGHPWLKPVRNCLGGRYDFYRMEGEGVHELAVGPIHAGIIEPGHFRFQCSGEMVHHLEIMLGYQHRGVEEMMAGMKMESAPFLAESIAGDSVISNASAHAALMESLCGCVISRRSQAVRGVALELERIAIHLGDLSAIAGDIAFIQGKSIYGALRTKVINSFLSLCGSRFGRGLIRPGGVVYDIDPEYSSELAGILRRLDLDTQDISEAFFSSSSVLARLEQTGILTYEDARALGMVGPAARASGLPVDTRSDHPYRIYRNFPIHKITLPGGDVFSRAYIRYIEIRQSIKFILEVLDNLPGDAGGIVPLGESAPGSLTISLVESWRGETFHAAVTGNDGKMIRYKITDPSFHNWTGLALAARNNGISDFPVCNKSFSLSYCGFDL